MGGFFATNIGSTMPFGMDGWRFAFHLMAAVSLVTSALVLYVATDPRPTAKVHMPSALTHTPFVCHAHVLCLPLLVGSAYICISHNQFGSLLWWCGVTCLSTDA